MTLNLNKFNNINSIALSSANDMQVVLLYISTYHLTPSLPSSPSLPPPSFPLQFIRFSIIKSWLCTFFYPFWPTLTAALTHSILIFAKMNKFPWTTKRNFFGIKRGERVRRNGSGVNSPPQPLMDCINFCVFLMSCRAFPAWCPLLPHSALLFYTRAQFLIGKLWVGWVPVSERGGGEIEA